ncbi:hypothetical protein [Actinocatenispora rupis]|uniref:Uncharacterized protein n=1 Tax=Actinocatenispora rupis TaxID=519421 RepID=A0A8J3NF58_9ACTN|nr:hypothetical protein [Actinocatenispora rupis]GID14872.1 hypothetical protein Aru02nite_57610 [Actinocatenispora rupis]
MSYVPATAYPTGGERPPNVTPAAIGLIIAGAVSFVSGAIWMAAGLSVINDEANKGTQLGGSDAVAYMMVLSPVLSVFLAPATIIGGVQMLRRRTRNLAVLGAIFAVVPFTGCCFLAGIPVGIWALLTLRRPDVAAWYAGRPVAAPPQPPPYGPPPQYW